MTLFHKKWAVSLLTAGLLAGLTQPGQAQSPSAKTALPATEDDYYKMVTLPVPEGVVLEVGGLAVLPNNKLAVSTRRGDVYLIDNPYMDNYRTPYFRKFASGLHEILGLAYKDGSLYMAQRGELTKLTDRDGDGRADRYETVYAWPISAHYHEYSFGPILMPDGSMFVTGNVAFGDQEWWRGESRVPWRGWTMRITPDGKMEPWATGMRSPCGIGLVDGQFFYADNQGDWMGSGFIMPVNKGDFTGHPAGLRWTNRPESPVKLTDRELYAKVDPRFSPPDGPLVKPENIESERGKALFEVAKEIPAVKTPAVWLPHSVLGISTSEIVTNNTGGTFGPFFEGQLFVGDQGQSKIDRVFLEKVNGTWQGAAFPFREGFMSGVLRMAWGRDGSMFVGQTNRGWGSTGKAPFGLQRLVWSGRTPFEMKTIRAMPDGFEVEFTQPVDKKTAEDPASYELTGFIYKYHPVYGSPIIDDKNCAVKGIAVSPDGMKVRLVVDGLREKYVHEVKIDGVRNQSGQPLLHNAGYYTLNVIPEGRKLAASEFKAVTVNPHAGHTGMKMNETVSPDGPAGATAKAGTTPAAKGKPATGAKPAALAKRTTVQPASWTNGPDQVITIGTQPGLKFDQTKVTVKAGSKIKWTFANNDDMPHNCVIVQPGTALEVGDQAIKMGLKGMNQGYIPNSAKILYHTKLNGPGAADTIYLVAPDKPGQYTYVCTVPGHASLMQGTLEVVP